MNSQKLSIENLDIEDEIEWIGLEQLPGINWINQHLAKNDPKFETNIFEVSGYGLCLDGRPMIGGGP